MNRTVAAAFAAIAAALVALGLFLPLSAGAADAYVEGQHYERLPVALETADTSKVEVVEVFSYACIHCYNFEPDIATWRGRFADGVAFRRVPAIFSPEWRVLAQAYYTAEALKVVDKVHQPLFEGIHKQRINLVDPVVLAELFERSAGVSPADFKNAFDSMTVRLRVQQADAYGRTSRIQGVPTMIVNGKYRVTGEMAGDNRGMLQVVDYLVDRERSAEALPAAAAPNAAAPDADS